MKQPNYAAAPKMLEALKGAQKLMQKTGITYDNADVYNSITNAIKEAIGETVQPGILQILTQNGYQQEGYGYKKVTAENTHWVTVLGKGTEIQVYGYFTGDPEFENIYDTGIIQANPDTLQVLISIFTTDHQ